MKNLLLTLFTILCFIDFASNIKLEFDNFIKNQAALKLIQSYKEKQIKTIKELHDELTKKGIKMGIFTLKRYLSKIKSAVSDATNQSPRIVEMKFEKCLSRDLWETIYLIGNENKWQKYRVMNENRADIYIGCTKSLVLQNKEKNKKPIVSRAVLREGEKLVITQSEHNPECKAETMEIIKAEQVDRKQIFKCNTDVKTIWRQGLEKVREEDANENVDSFAQNALTNHYPSWVAIEDDNKHMDQKQQTPLMCRQDFS